MFEIAEYIGIFAFAISGFFVAIRAELDLLGVVVSAFLTAFGGGIIRDIMVDKTPYIFLHTWPAVLVGMLIIVLMLFGFHHKEDIENRTWFIISDSIGLISFSITGALLALEHYFQITGVLVLSFVTAVGGGIMRDVIINEVPFIFKTGFYGTVSLLAGGALYVLERMDNLNAYWIAIVFATGVLLRIAGYYKKWSMSFK